MKDVLLIIEGIPEPRKQLAVDLANEYEVAAVPNYLAGLSALKRLNPEMLIMNLRLPLIDGWERTFDAGSDFSLKVPFSKLKILSRIKSILRRTSRKSHSTPTRE